MSTTADAPTSPTDALAVLGRRFASELPELSVPWSAAEPPEPELLLLNEPLAVELGLDLAELRRPEGLGLLVGTTVPAGATPVAQAYGGHQFGRFNPGLGDGRALLMGELGSRDLHLKGSGRTPFARGGDGLAAVGPMLREYVLAEAMHALGIPTTRALSVVATGATLRREVPLPGAVLARVAASHLRVGSFQLARGLVAGDEDSDLLVRLADHAIARHHPDAAHAEHPHRALLEAVVAAQAALVAQWMLVGFVHGVMNTDNMTISGETIDYGPCAFLDAYEPTTWFSSIDEHGRYAYANQPVAAEWDLARLAESMLPLIHEDQDRAVELALESLAGFRPAYTAAWSSGMAAKLGLSAEVPEAVTTPLFEDLLALLQAGQVDWTAFFRALGTAARGDDEPSRGLVLDLPAYDAWLARWRSAAADAGGPDADAMDRVNPVYVPRNHLVEEALAAGTAGDLGPVRELIEVLTAPYDERPGLERYAAASPADPGYRTFCGT